MSNSENHHDENLSANMSKLSLTVKDVAERVGETPFTIRNWFKDLRAYIPHEKAENGYNYFDEKSLKAFFTIKDLHRDRSYSIKQIEYYFATGGEEFVPIPKGANEELLAQELLQMRETLAKVNDRLERQEQFNMALSQKLDEQTAFIIQNVKKRDEEITEGMARMFERYEQKRLEAPKEEKKRFWQFWK